MHFKQCYVDISTSRFSAICLFYNVCPLAEHMANWHDSLKANMVAIVNKAY